MLNLSELARDLGVDAGDELIPIEVNLSGTPNRGMAKGIESFRKDLGPKAGRGFVVHPGEIKLTLGPDAKAWPFGEL